jgi:biotin carboxyl carrier protein
VLDAPGDRALREAAVRLARNAGYRNAGTVEFLYQPASGASAFLEVNTRLQVEHPVTELTTGVDIVKLQIDLAAGGRLEGEPPAARGHAIEARLNAEDPERGFAPAPGLVEQLDLPSGPGIRVDTGLAAGDVIPAEYDSMIAKVIALGRDREEALARLGRALEETTVVVQGGTTNKSFLLGLLDRPEVRGGTATTGWLDTFTADQERGLDATRRRHADVALVAAAIEVAAEGEAREQARFFTAAARGRAQAGRDMGNRVEFRYAGVPHLLTVGRFGRGTYWIEDDTARTLVELERLRPHVNRITVGGGTHRVVSVDQGTDLLVEVDGVSHRVSRDDGGVVRAPAPGLVVSIPVEVDQIVEAGATVAILEAMKMETAIVATAAGKVREILVVGNVQVDAGTPLVRLEALDGASTSASGERVTLERFARVSSSPLAPRDQALQALGSLRGALLGFDLDRAAVTDLLELYTTSRPAVADDDRAVLDAELDLVEMFADLSELFRNRRADDPDDVVDETRSAREHFLTYLRSLDVEREGLPDSFAGKLHRALAHYGVEELDRTPALEEAVFRLFLAHEWAPDHLAVVRAVLGQVDRVASGRDPRLRAALDRLVVAAQVRFPDVGELARAVRYRLVDEPLLAGQRAAAYARVRDVAGALDREPHGAERDALMSELVTCPYPLLTQLLDRIDASRATPDPIVEAVLRRYYVIRDLRDVRPEVHDGHQIVQAQYGPVERPHHVLTLATRWDRFDSGARHLAGLARRSPAVEDCVLEIYLRADGDVPGRDNLAKDVLAGLEAAGLSAVRRASVSVGEPGADPCQLAFRNEGGCLREDRVASG